jgi:hypothetical protein
MTPVLFSACIGSTLDAKPIAVAACRAAPSSLSMARDVQESPGENRFPDRA